MRHKYLIITAVIIIIAVICNAFMFMKARSKTLPDGTIPVDTIIEVTKDSPDYVNLVDDWIYDPLIPVPTEQEYPVIEQQDTDHSEFYEYNGEMVEGFDEFSINSSTDNIQYRARIQHYMSDMQDLFNNNYNWDYDNNQYLDRWFGKHHPTVRGLDGVVYAYKKTDEGLDFQVLFFKSSIRIECHYSYRDAVITSVDELEPGPYYILYADFPGWWERELGE